MFARFDENPAMTLRVIKETKRYGRTDARTDGQRENSIPPTNKVCGGYNYHHLLILEICQGEVDAPAVANSHIITKPKMTYLQRATTPEGIMLYVPSSNLKKTL